MLDEIYCTYRVLFVLSGKTNLRRAWEDYRNNEYSMESMTSGQPGGVSFS